MALGMDTMLSSGNRSENTENSMATNISRLWDSHRTNPWVGRTSWALQSPKRGKLKPEVGWDCAKQSRKLI